MSEIPVFPKFTKLTPQMRHLLPRAKIWSQECSDFSFANLITWDVNDSALISQLHNNFVVKLPSYNNTSDTQVMLLGNTQTTTSIDSIFEYESVDFISLVPESTIATIKDANRYTITEDRDSFDYLYDLNSLVALEGPGYRHFRRGLNGFTSKQSEDFSYVHNSSLTEEVILQIIDITNMWGISHYNTADYDEGRAIHKALNNAEVLDLRIAIVTTKNLVVGFIIYELLTEAKQVIVHFEKASNKFPFLSYFTKHSFYQEMLKDNYTVLNYEQDLGIEGLRFTKLSLQPKGFNKKYCVAKLGI